MKKAVIWAIVLALPPAVLGQNLLLDPSFSAPSTITCSDHPSEANWNYTNWQYWTSAPNYGNKCRRNAETHGPTCPRDPAGDNDSMRGSISWGEPSSHRIYQTVAVTTGQTYNLSGFWAGGNDTSTKGTFKVELRDGAGYSGTLLGSYGGDIPASQAFNWTALSLSGTAQSNQMTVVVYGYVNSWGAHSIHVDDLLLEVAPCPTPPTIDEPIAPATNPTPDHGARGTSVNGVQIKGTNFESGKMTVKLRQGTTEILATNVTISDSTTMTCNLDLTGAGLGYWDLVVEKADCPPAAVLLNAFRVVLAGPSLHNASFELPSAPAACPVTPQGTPSDWTFTQFDFFGGPYAYRDEDQVFPPSCPPPDGDHYVSAKSDRGGGVTRATQTVTCTPGTTYTLTGQFAGGGGNVVRIALLDGGPDDPVLGETVVYNGDAEPTAYDWTFGYASGTASKDIITVRWEVGNTGAGGSNRSAHADALALQPCTGSVSVSAFAPSAAGLGEVLAGATITGSGFSGTTPVVYLSRPGNSIPGTSINVADDATMTCDFDLTSASVGAYDLIVGNNGCFATLPGAVMVASPVLINGEFEEPTATQNCGPPPTPVAGLATGWSFLAPDEFVRDQNVWYPTCPCPYSAGGHYATMSTGFGYEQRAWQTLKVDTGKNYRFAGWFAGGGSNTATIKLVDGADPVNGTVLGSTVVKNSTATGYDWQYSFVQALAGSEVMTVVWEMAGIGDTSATHADGLTFETPCNDPFADVDGDGDVDQSDFAIFQLCFTGTGQGTIPATPEYCKCLDVDGTGGQPDGDIDQADLVKFEACASGPGVTADTTCDD